MLSFAPIRTPRLDLVALEPADAVEMVAVLADPSLYAFTGGEPPDLATLRGRYERQASGRSPDGTEQWLNWIARVRDSGAPVGFVQATLRATGPDGGADVADVAWLIGAPWQHQGFGSEAAMALVGWLVRAGVPAIEAHIQPGHLGSEAVARRAGMTPTGRLDGGGEEVWRRVQPGSAVTPS